MSEETTFKLIVALKFISELPKDLSSSIVVAEITKNAVLPLHEGLYFDLVQLPKTMAIYFVKGQHELTKLQVDIPDLVYTQEETELANDFSLTYRDPQSQHSQSIKGSYYVIVLNKKVFIQKNQNLKKVQFETIENERRIKTQPCSNGKQKSSKQSPQIKKKVKKTSVKEDIENVVNQHLTSMNLDQQNLNESEIENCSALSKLRSLDLSQEHTPRDNLVTPTKAQSRKVVQKASSTQSFSPMIKQEQIKIPTNLSSQNQYLKLVVWNLDQQVQQYCSNKEMCCNLKLQLQEASNKFEDKYRDNFIKSFELQQQKLQDQLDSILQQYQQLISKFEQKSAEMQNTEKQLSVLIISEKDKALELFELQTQLNEFKQLEQKVINQDQTIDQLTKLNVQLQDELKHAVKQQQDDRANSSHKILSIKEENWGLRQKVTESKLEIKKLLISIDQKEHQITELQDDTNTRLSDQERQITTLLQEQQIHLKQIADLKSQNQTLIQQNEQLKGSLTKLAYRRFDDDRWGIEQLEHLKKQLADQETKVHQLEHNLQQSQRKITEHLCTINRLNHIEGLSLEQQKQISTLAKQLRIVVDANDSLNHCLEKSREAIQQIQDEKVLLLNKIYQYDGQIEDRDSLLSNLKHVVLNQREQGISYIPFPNDTIDKKVAEFVTDRDDRLKYLLIREQSGVYSFGRRRLFMKIEQDKLLVKTGGGFVRAEQFFDQPTLEIEMDRYDRSVDPRQLVQQGKRLDKKGNSRPLSIKN